MDALHAFYSELLGKARETTWRFDLSALYAGAATVDGTKLVAPFRIEEVEAAVNGLDRTSAPGPDGLGPAYYQAAWTSIAGDVMRLFDGVFSSSVDLACINRAHIVLLPKGDGVLAPGGFRPVSLQNCDVKIVCKTLTTRLQQQISGMVDVDQSGFIKG